MQEAFPEYEVELVNKSKAPQPQRPFRITFPPFKPQEEEQPAAAKVGVGWCCVWLQAVLLFGSLALLLSRRLLLHLTCQRHAVCAGP